MKIKLLIAIPEQYEAGEIVEVTPEKGYLLVSADCAEIIELDPPKENQTPEKKRKGKAKK